MEELGAIVAGIFGISAALLSGLFFMIWILYAVVMSMISLTLFVFWIIALIDCIKRDDKDFTLGGDNAKLIWILMLLLAGGIAGVVYYVLIMREKPAKKKE